MKKAFLFFAAMATTLAACQKEILLPEQPAAEKNAAVNNAGGKLVVNFTAQNYGRDTSSHEDSTVMFTKLSYSWSSANSKIKTMEIFLDGSYLKTVEVTKERQYETIPSSVHPGQHDMLFIGKESNGQEVQRIDFPYMVEII